MCQRKHSSILTGSKKEADLFRDSLISSCPHAVNMMGQFSLTDLMSFIAHCDGLVASGTGPLHLAESFGIHTLVLLPPLRHVGPIRWTPLGAQTEHLSLPKLCKKQCSNTECPCMRAISVTQVKEKIMAWNTMHKTKH